MTTVAFNPFEKRRPSRGEFPATFKDRRPTWWPRESLIDHGRSPRRSLGGAIRFFSEHLKGADPTIPDDRIVFLVAGASLVELFRGRKDRARMLLANQIRWMRGLYPAAEDQAHAAALLIQPTLNSARLDRIDGEYVDAVRRFSILRDLSENGSIDTFSLSREVADRIVRHPGFRFLLENAQRVEVVKTIFQAGDVEQALSLLAEPVSYEFVGAWRHIAMLRKELRLFILVSIGRIDDALAELQDTDWSHNGFYRVCKSIYLLAIHGITGHGEQARPRAAELANLLSNSEIADVPDQRVLRMMLHAAKLNFDLQNFVESTRLLEHGVRLCEQVHDVPLWVDFLEGLVANGERLGSQLPAVHHAEQARLIQGSGYEVLARAYGIALDRETEDAHACDRLTEDLLELLGAEPGLNHHETSQGST